MKKVSRNDPCWCGSTEKYKKCHLEYDQDRQRKLSVFAQRGYPVPDIGLLKTGADIEGIRKSGQLTKSILDALSGFIQPGISTDAINEFVHEMTIKNHAIPAPLNYKGFPKSCCTSVNEVICHGIPSDRRLLEGDIVNVDVTCILNGYYGDSCRMYEVGKVSERARRLSDVSKACLDAAISVVQPYLPISVIGEAIEKVAHEAGFSVVRDFVGHGIGQIFHQSPYVPHFKPDYRTMIMAPGMVFTIEPMINEGKWQSKVLADGWTAETIDGKLSAQWEHTVAVTDQGVDVLTA